MTFTEQLEKLKDNWLVILLVVVVLGAMMLLPKIGTNYSSRNYTTMDSALGYASGYYPESVMYKNYSQQNNFAPDVTDRKIVKTSNLGIEVKLGKFSQTDSMMRDIIKSSSSFILNENIYSSKVNSKDVYTGSYTIKVETSKLDQITNQLKTLGKITSYNQGADDVTGQYTNVKIELQVEKERLERYKQLYEDAKTMEDKINLNDRIFNQERTIKYLEDSIKNIDERVDYSTIYLTINERSDYIYIAFVKLSELVSSFVGSLNSLLRLIFLVLPWAVLGGVIYAIIRLTKKKQPTFKKR